MKRMPLFAVLLALPLCVSASVLRPSVVIYGEVRDPYGIRLREGAQVSLYSGTNELVRTNVGLHPGNICYKLILDVHDPLTAGPGQVKPGDAVQVVVKIGGAVQSQIGAAPVTVPGDGTYMRVNVLLGTDADGDGLPDEWEQMVIANSGGAATALGDIGPDKDLDGDGADDDEEFWNGSFAFLAGDVLRLSSLREVNDRFEIKLFTADGAVYSVETAATLATPDWTACPLALTETDPVTGTQFRGTGGLMAVYLVSVDRSAYFRLRLH